jgi:uncharacterized protein YbjT (DUF2867 family)
MHLLVLGASGGIGQWLVRLAAERRHTVRALVRPDARIDVPQGVQLIRGEPLDPIVLDTAVAGVDAVASCLGRRRAGRSPWSAPLSPPALMARITPAVIASMGRNGVQRLVVVSAGGVGDSAGSLSAPVRWLVRQGQIAVSYRDLEMMEQALADSTLDWLAVRPVTLVDGAPTAPARDVSRYGFTSFVRRADVAARMLGALEAPPPFARRTVLLG